MWWCGLSEGCVEFFCFFACDSPSVSISPSDPLHFSSQGAISVVLLCLVTSVVCGLSAENRNLERSLMQLLKEMVHPTVVCHSAEGGSPWDQLWKTNKSDGNDSLNPANIWCWTLPKKAFRLNKHGTAFICCLKPLLPSTSLPYGSTRTIKSHKKCY